jgi:hypothetical protein
MPAGAAVGAGRLTQVTSGAYLPYFL